MDAGLSVRVVEIDDYHLGVDVRAWNDRFCATSFVYVGLHELGEFATAIEGFPHDSADKREFAFSGGGYCGLRFGLVDQPPRAVLDVTLEDDCPGYSSGKAEFRIPVEAAWVDRFVDSLRLLDRNRMGEAVMGPSL